MQSIHRDPSTKNIRYSFAQLDQSLLTNLEILPLYPLYYPYSFSAPLLKHNNFMVFYKWDSYFYVFISLAHFGFNYFTKVNKPLELIAFASTKKKKDVPIFIDSLLINDTCYDGIVCLKSINHSKFECYCNQVSLCDHLKRIIDSPP